MLNYIFNKYANDNHALNMFLKSVLDLYWCLITFSRNMLNTNIF